MSSLPERLQSDLTRAMKARDSQRVATLRMALTAIHNQRVASGQVGEVTDEQVLELLTREAKKRAEAAEAYRAGGREELAAKEDAELAILREYLPEQLSDDELRAVVDEVLAETGAAAPSDMGRVMSAVMPRVKGRADGKRVSAIVRERLTAS